jgi:1,2-beta-oligoglucan phosphorylase
MTVTSKDTLVKLASRCGLSCEINANGSLRRMGCGDIALNLFLGNEIEGGPANLYLRRRGGGMQYVELLGPRSPTHFQHEAAQNRLVGSGVWQGIRYSVALTLADAAPAWFWHVAVENISEASQELDLIYAQDVALAPYGTVRLNEYYVSQYVDHTALEHKSRGSAVASRQNLAASGRNAWCIIGSLRRGLAYATDALQVHGLATRAGTAPVGIVEGLPSRRLQHEHSMVAIQDEPLLLQPGARAAAGFFGSLMLDHPAATSPSDLDHIDHALSLAEAKPPQFNSKAADPAVAETVFSAHRLLRALDLDAADHTALFAGGRRHEEFDEHGQLLSFFYGADHHVVTRAKELRVQRPHGHLLRTGVDATPDETALTSTTWMNGVFHSMLTQGHVSINRCLSSVHSYLGLFRSHGQRVFVESAGTWQLLDVPSAFEMAPEQCRWIYKHAGGVIEVRSCAHSDPHELSLTLEVVSGEPVRFLISHHVALNGDDGSTSGSTHWRRNGEGIALAPGEGTELAARYPEGYFHIVPINGTSLETIGGDELLFTDGRSRQQPYVCFITAAARSAGLRWRGHLVTQSVDIPSRQTEAIKPALSATLQIQAATANEAASAVGCLADIVPWFIHNAFIHYLSPRGLEQYSGGGWGTRDVSQGPVELLLALGHPTPVRDLLLRVMRAQQPDGDWPQWFMFFERERDIRAGDSHGDIVFWPVLALAQYLIASGDETLLDERVSFFQSPKSQHEELATVWQHVERALQVIERRVIAGTALAAYGHGDWNDALQPADPSMREHMCSAWTVTLHHQTLLTLARALRVIGRDAEAGRLEAWAAAVQRDFQRLLLVDGVLTGYALFDESGSRAESGPDVFRYLLHPRDQTTGVRYSVLAMIHAILEDMLTPEQAREHLALIERHLSGPDGVRLFDRPMPYHGGTQRFFQRAESATFFGREIGLMYMHAHLRYAQALAHMGEADRFFRALCHANPIGIRDIVPIASLRQANCYYSSSDAAFADRYQASAEYERVASGAIALDGGWRVYSSGAGIALSLIIRRFLGLSFEHETLAIDPVIPAALDGLRVQLKLFGHAVEVVYQIQGAGHGVSSIEVNHHALPLTFDSNPFRKGAARVSIAAFTARLTEQANVVRIGLD